VLALRVIRLSISLLPLSFTLATPAAAQQEDGKAQARQHFQRGVELANQNAYAESLLEFSRAYELSPHYSVLYNIGQAHVALGHSAQAVEALKRYLGEGGANIALDRRQEVEAQVIRQFERTATLEVRVDRAGARVTVDGEPRGAAPLAGPVRVDIGTHQVMARLDSGESSEQTVTVAGKENRLIELQLNAPAMIPKAPFNPSAAVASRTPAPLPSPSQRQNHGRSTLGWALSAAGVALGGAALGHYFWNRARHRDWQAKYARYFAEPSSENRDDANQLAESIPRANVVTVSLSIGAGLALGSGTLLLLTDSGGKNPVGSLAWHGVW
jgi:hypothetical protein